MKKLIAILLAFAAAMSMVACSGVDRVDDKGWSEGAASGEHVSYGENQDEFDRNKATEPEKPVETTEPEKPAETTEPVITTAPDLRTAIDPFDGLKFVPSGVSPYCQVGLNNQGCSRDAQLYVEYTFDKEIYANGDTVTVTAQLSRSADPELYFLTQSQATYTLSNQPEYITSVDGVDLTLLESELNDYVKAQVASAIEYYKFFDISAWRFVENYYDSDYANIDTSLEEKYCSALKLTKQNKMDKKTPFNKISYVYSFSVVVEDTLRGTFTGTVFVTIHACNVIKYPDGSIQWGTTGPEAYDFTWGTSVISLENCVSICIMKDSADYNITKIEK